MHIVLILLAGVLSVLYFAPLVGVDMVSALVPVATVVALLTVFFFFHPYAASLA